jgi:hypothetical protein
LRCDADLRRRCARHAEKRVALVIGNDRYTNLPAEQQLKKAVNDARAVGDALKHLDFFAMVGLFWSIVAWMSSAAAAAISRP